MADDCRYKAVSGALRFKGGDVVARAPKKHKKEKKKKHKKDKHNRKRHRDADNHGKAASASAAAAAGAEEEPELQILSGTGRFLSSGTAVQGKETRFQSELAIGDAIVVRHPTTLREETRIVTMVLSDISIAISSPFSTDLISTVPFQYVKAPKRRLDEAAARDAKRQKQSDAEKQAFGTYAGGGALGECITFRRKKAGAFGGYEIVTQRNTQGSLSREDLLDMRCSNKGDRHAM